MRGFIEKRKFTARTVWTATYATILILSLISSLVCYVILNKSTKEQLNERNSIILENIALDIDSQLKEINESVIVVALDKKVQDIAEDLEISSLGANRTRIYEFVNELKYISALGHRNDDNSFMIYYGHIDQIMKVGTSHTLRGFYDAYLYADGMEFSTWEKLIKGKYENGIFYKTNFFGIKDEILYIKSIDCISDREKTINIIYKIDKDSMAKNVKHLYRNEYGIFAVRNEIGETILEIGPQIDKFRSYNDIDELKKDKGVCVFEKVSEDNGWQYLYIMPESIAYKRTQNSKIVVFIIMLLSLILGVWLVIRFTNMNYTPIKKILSLFPEEDDKEEYNEYKILENKISGVISDSTKMGKILDNQRVMLRGYLLGSILSGECLEENEYESLNFNVKDGEFVAFIVHIPENNGNEDTKERFYKYFALENILDEMLSKLGYTFYSIEKKSNLVYMVEINEKASREDLYSAVDLTYEIIKKEFECELCLSFGRTHKGVYAIAQSYTDATYTLDYCIRNDSYGRNEYDKIKDLRGKNYNYSLEKEDKIINLLRENEEEKLSANLEAIYKENLKNNKFTLNAARFLTMELFSTLKKAFTFNGKLIEKEMPEHVRFMESIFSCDSIERMQSVMQSAFSEGAKILSNKQHCEDVVQKVKEYIQKNYQNANLNVNTIADVLSMNSSYVSRKFKEETQMRIIDYLNSVRVEKSKELLKNNDCLIADVGNRVGFSSYRTFVRTFSNITGITPKNYRNM